MAEYVKMAVQNILANKGRSFLTMLGIIIGHQEPDEFGD